MAEKKITLLLCDICGAEPAERFVLGRENGGGRAEGKRSDLCVDHAKPITDALAYSKGPSVSVTVRATRAGTSRRPGLETKIYTQDELDRIEFEGK